MKRNNGKYTDMQQLPDNASTVADYANKRGCTPQYIYKLIKQQRADFQIVTFKGINFIIPLTNN